MFVLNRKIKVEELKDLKLFNEDNSYFSYMVKMVVDVKKEIIALNSELHSDLEEFLVSLGSNNKNLYGINITFDPYEIEFDSLINPPRNRDDGYPRAGRTVESPERRKEIERIVKKWIEM